MVEIPSLSGVYALHLLLPTERRLLIGRLGTVDFPAGEYIYIGSARGPGGLHARLKRHLRDDAKLHWHIDYLRTESLVLGCWYAITEISLECKWSHRLTKHSALDTPIPGFGCSDCRSKGEHCRTHLFHLSSNLPPADLSSWLAAESSMGCPKISYVSLQDKS